jgi:hypothetical protein
LFSDKEMFVAYMRNPNPKVGGASYEITMVPMNSPDGPQEVRER